MATFNGGNGNRRSTNNGLDCADSGFGSSFVSLTTLVVIIVVLILMVAHILYSKFGTVSDTQKNILNVLQYIGLGFSVLGSLFATYNYVVVSRMKACIQ